MSNDYVDKINTDSIVGVVIEEIVNELDPHSVYIPVVQKQALSESMLFTLKTQMVCLILMANCLLMN